MGIIAGRSTKDYVERKEKNSYFTILFRVIG